MTRSAATATKTTRQSKRASERRPPARTRLRSAAYALVGTAIALAAVWLVASRLLVAGPSASGAVQIQASMGGFQPAAITVRAGADVKVELVSTDSAFHSDGGGWHEMAIDELGIDWKVGPESSKVFEFTAPTKPGTYTWFCGICCGGRANPSMQGKLTVTA